MVEALQLPQQGPISRTVLLAWVELGLQYMTYMGAGMGHAWVLFFWRG